MRLHSNNKNIKIAICIPCRETVHSLFSYNLVQMTQWCNLAGYKVFVLMESGSLISRQRQNLTKAAIDQGASHILWLDSDMMFPADIIDSMLRHNLDIVACNYSTRTVPFKGVAYTKIGDWNSWLRPYTGRGKKLRAVEGVGMGCMLVNVDVDRKSTRLNSSH